MSLQIKGKFIQLEAGEALKQKKADGSVVELIKVDESVSEGSQVLVAGEQVARASEVAAEKSRAQTAEAGLASDIAAEVSNRAAAMLAEENARIAADAATLASANSYTDTQVAALVASAPAVLDTLKELADAISDDPNFATTVANQVAGVQSNLTAEVSRATAAEASLAADIASATSASTAAVAAEQARAEAAEAALSASLSAEQAARQAADALKLNLAGGTMSAGAVVTFQENVDYPETPGINPDEVYTAKIDSNGFEAKYDYVDGTLVTDKVNVNGWGIELSSTYGNRSLSMNPGYIGVQCPGGGLNYSVGENLITFKQNVNAGIRSHKICLGDLTSIGSIEGIKLSGGVSLFNYDSALSPTGPETVFVPTAPEHATTKAYVDTAISSLQSSLSAEISAEEAARIAADSAEASARIAADGAEQARAEAAEAALSGRVTSLEGKLHRKMKFVLTSTDIANGYVELAHEAMVNSIVAAVGRLMIHEGMDDDFTVAAAPSGVTRMTFVNSLVTPGQEKLSVGDVIFVKYMA